MRCRKFDDIRSRCRLPGGREGNAVNAMGKSTLWRYLRIVDPSYILAIAFCVSFLAFYGYPNEEMGNITSISFFSLFCPINGCTCDQSALVVKGFGMFYVILCPYRWR